MSAVVAVRDGTSRWSHVQSAELTRIERGTADREMDTEGLEIVELADHVVAGEADLEFARLCRSLLDDAGPDRIARDRKQALERAALADLELHPVVGHHTGEALDDVTQLDRERRCGRCGHVGLSSRRRTA